MSESKLVWSKMLSRREMKVEDEIEDGLGSVGKFRILRLLAKDADKCYTKYALEKKTGLKRVNLKNDLEDLKSIGWVIEYEHEPKKYKLNKDNHTVNFLLDFFRKTRYI